MSELFRGTYRTESSRLASWDYSQGGYYFVTICTKAKGSILGDVINEGMRLNAVGQIAQKCWLEIYDHFPRVELDEFVIMPDHVHGILILNGIEKRRDAAPPRLKIENEKEMYLNHQNGQRDEAVPRLYNQAGAKNLSVLSPEPGSLSVIIGSFKSAVTRMVRQQEPSWHFSWQPRFYDRIIRSDRELDAIRMYIRNNPQQWELDRGRPDPIEF